MSARKLSPDLSGLVATKGQATPVSGVPARSAAPAAKDSGEGGNVPLNFRVSADLRRRFRTFAATHDLKLNELLRRAFDEYEQKHG
jgi:hypothetical protein